MRVALVNEGTYPYVTGGVSTWCDQLVRGLTDVTWDLVAIVGTEPERAALAVPDNVRSLVTVPVWGPPRLGRARPAQARSARGRSARASAERAAALVCAGMLDDGPQAITLFAEGLHQLATLAQPSARSPETGMRHRFGGGAWHGGPGLSGPGLSVPGLSGPGQGGPGHGGPGHGRPNAGSPRSLVSGFGDRRSATPATGRFTARGGGIHPLAGVVVNDILLDAWRRAVADGARLPRLTLREADQAASLIEHAVRPLAATIPADVDVCHANANGLSSMVALATKWRTGVPFLMTEHGVYLRERYLASADESQTAGVKTAILRFHRALARLAYAEADAIAPVSSFNSRWAVRHGADPRTVTVIGNGVDPGRFPLLAAETDEPVISWVGRIDPLKDLETLIRALAVVRRTVPDARLHLAGPVPAGNEAYAQGLRELAGELGVGNAVHFVGPVASSREAFGAGQVAALSSISEGMPYTVLEAMMCGRATVSTDVGGVAEAVGDAGLVVPPRDPEAFGAACAELLADAGRRHELAAAGRARALREYTLDRCLRAYRNRYADLSGLVPAGHASGLVPAGHASGLVPAGHASGLVPAGHGSDVSEPSEAAA